MVTGNGCAAGPRELPADWREMVLHRVLSLTAVAGPITLVVFVLLRRPPRFDVTTAVVAATISALVAMRALPRLGLALRTWVATGALVAAGTAALLRLGPLLGPGMVMAIAAVLACLVLGRRAGLTVAAITALLIAVSGVLLTRGLVVPRPDSVEPHDLETWLRTTAIYAVFSTLLVVLVDHVVGQLSRQYTTAIRALDQLEAEVQEREERERLSAERLRALQRLALSDVVESGNLPAAFGEIAEAGAQALGIERCSVWLLDESGDRLRCFDLYDRGTGQHSRGMELKAADHPEYFAALAEERALAAEDALHDPRTRTLGAVYLVPSGVGAMLDAPIRYGERVVGVVCHEHVGGRRAFGTEACGFAGSIGDFAARALGGAERSRQERALREAYDQLVQLHRRLEGAKEEERREMAHELHDELGQSLTALKLRFQMLSRNPAPSTIAAQAGEALQLIDNLIARVRRISVDLRPPLLDEVGLGPALRTYLDGQAALSGLPIAFEASTVGGRLPAEIEIGAFRVVQEGVTNALRHAGAASLRVELRRDPARLHLRVHDDGRGFDVEEAHHKGARGARFGLVGMRERLRGLGGTLTIRSRPGQGTEVEAQLPLG
jgi:signal transduction histidine kinase